MAVHVRHADIHEHDLRPEPARRYAHHIGRAVIRVHHQRTHSGGYASDTTSIFITAALMEADSEYQYGVTVKTAVAVSLPWN